MTRQTPRNDMNAVDQAPERSVCGTFCRAFWWTYLVTCVSGVFMVAALMVLLGPDPNTPRPIETSIATAIEYMVGTAEHLMRLALAYGMAALRDTKIVTGVRLCEYLPDGYPSLAEQCALFRHTLLRDLTNGSSVPPPSPPPSLQEL